VAKQSPISATAELLFSNLMR